ncbi:Type II 3-dehydroquinate dehydratase [Zalerion maritima]|uniref:Catabolic 3-dehydroquinase n=1 Tax=Zalerion maritima TaxID=339359 RepID=A0AAD5RJH5_9PEZI|nr:Type II 3-dehydroquinate dehydratase [Zalerion maritima]
MTTATPPSKTTILLLHGPNLNLLGTREPGIYGSATLSSINSTCTSLASTYSTGLQHFQTNHEGRLIDRIHEAASANSPVGAIIINPAAFTHQSVAVRDALLGVGLPFVEVHLSNVHAREEWRSKSYFSDKAKGVICGLGPFGYEAAVMFCCRELLGAAKKGDGEGEGEVD